jgi:hypothetical protein
VEPYHKHFALDNVSDREWLRYIGTKGWIALSHNKYIRYERDELDELMTCGVKAFFIIGKGPHAAYAGAILRNLDGIYRCVRETAEPFVAKVYQNREEVSLWVTYTTWLEERRTAAAASNPSTEP